MREARSFSHSAYFRPVYIVGHSNQLLAVFFSIVYLISFIMAVGLANCALTNKTSRVSERYFKNTGNNK
jgi:hypothetical protein